MGTDADSPRTAATPSRWTPVPPRPHERSWHTALQVFVPVVVVIGPIVAMYLADVTDRRVAFSAAVGLCGSASVYLIERLLHDWRLRLAALVVVAVGVGAVITRVTAVNYGVWMAVGLLVAGWLLGMADLDEKVASGIATFARGLVFVLFLPLALLFVLVPWVVNTIARLDPLRAPTTATSAWIKRQRLDPRARQPWAKDTNAAPLGTWYRVRSVAIWPLLVLIVILAVNGPPTGNKGKQLVLVNGIDGEPIDRVKGEVPVNSPYEGADWYDEYVQDIAWVESPATAWQPLQPHRIGDVTTRWVNIEDGVRKSWRAPECECERLTAWLYGGSTAFGLGQRDEHTIASELAREAWAHGIALDVDNRGVVGDVHWQESDRYNWDVATYGPPDLVIFYDGINDTTATQTLVNAKVGDRYAQVDFQNDDFWARFLDQLPAMEPEPLEGASVPEPPTIQTDGDEPFAELLMTRYNRSRKMSEAISKAYDVPTYYMWQPTRLSRPQVDGEPVDDGGHISGRGREAAIVAAIPDDVMDLTEVFIPYKNPMFYDDQHHNEQGAQIIAAAMFVRLADDLEKLATGASVPAP